MATHAYRAEDEDELNFEAGEIINVIDFDDPEDQDEGWLMGISTVTGGYKHHTVLQMSSNATPCHRWIQTPYSATLSQVGTNVTLCHR